MTGARPTDPMAASRWLLLALATMGLMLIVSGRAPYDRLTWLMEVMPVLLLMPVLWLSRERFPLSHLLLFMAVLHAAVLIMGGTYTYARVPLGFHMAEWLGTARNPYDKVGHFFQGFVPAMAAREILLRGGFVKAGRMLAFLVVCVVLAISATYELIEWAAALIMGQGADEFLGTQGDPWDTQSDMFMALLGALTMLLLASRAHDRSMARIAGGKALSSP